MPDVVKADIKLVKELRASTDLPMKDCMEALIESNNNLEEAHRILKVKGLAKAEKKSVNTAADGITKVLIDGDRAVIAELNCQTEQVAALQEYNNLFNKIATTILKYSPKTVVDALKLKSSSSADNLGDELKLAIAKLGENIVLTRFEIVTKNKDAVFGSYVHGGGKFTSLVVIKGVDNKSDVPHNIAMQIVSGNPKFIDLNSIPKATRDNELKILQEQAKDEKKPAAIIEKMIEGRLQKFFASLTIVDQDYSKDQTMKVKDYLTKNHATIITMVRYQLGEKIDNSTK
ncbi:translation elongation factor Ts [Spiroplasma endosymbiont of Virgichneumon dumeticola]|uniref:translation elongation factor Ts n=1 Tax=Spiroplasma endosymbiont of Virgichneumon dumeticola TaxID=3139323 RepID=UPI0035C8E9E7